MDQPIIEAIIPTIVIPFAFASFLFSAAAAFIASLFGIELKTEGPKRLLEVLLKPKVLGSALVMNFVIWGGYTGYSYLKNAPNPIFWITHKNKSNQLPENRDYNDVVTRENTAGNWLAHGQKIAGFKDQWTIDFATGFFNGVTISGNSAFAGNKDGYVYEIDTTTGKTLRRFYIGTHVTPAPLVWKGNLYVGEGVHDTHHARIYKFSLATGRLIDHFQTSGHTEGSPVIIESEGKAILLVSAGADGAYGVDPTSMQKIWHHAVGHVDSGFSSSASVVFFSTGVEKESEAKAPRHAFAVNALTGRVLWQRELAASSWMPSIIVKNEVCFGLGEIYWESRYGQLACFNRGTGVPTTTFNLDGAVTSLIDEHNGLLVFADRNGKVYLADIERRKILWTQETGETKGPSFASPSFLNDELLVFPTFNQGLFVFDIATGSIMNTWLPKGWSKVYSRVVPSTSGWYVTDYGGRIYKFVPQLEPRS